MQMPNKILTEYLFDNQVLRITLNAPKANVLDSAMMGEISGALCDLQSQPDIKLIQFRGAGDHFSFGASVQEHTKGNAPKMLEQFHGLFYSVIDLAIPTAAIVSGQCLGGALELALMCNFLFVDETAKLGQPEINLAVFAPPASLILPLKVGQAKADDLLLTGRIIGASEAVASGLATRAFDSRETMQRGVDEWIQKNILPKSASSLRFAVKASRHAFNDTLKERLKKIQHLYLAELMETHDANEGITSFLEKRPPKWENR
jgi:cyclohexa-1,5-dienecarbonyl-CoA hydratase